MTDTERLDKLEALIWSDKIGNGLAIWPSTLMSTEQRLVTLQDMGEEDGSDLGEELTEGAKTLREAIDALNPTPTKTPTQV